MHLSRRGLLSLALALAACGPRRCGGGPAGAAGLRVVSIAPSTTEAVCALGARGELVGRSRFCDFPPDVASLPAVGGFADPSVEAIVALRPTLVVGAPSPAAAHVAEAVRPLGADTLFHPTDSLADVLSLLRALGARLDRAPRAEALVSSIEAERARVARAIAGRPRPRAALVFDVSPLIVAGPGSYADELLRAAGADNALTAGQAYATLGPEQLLALDPDLLLDGTGKMGSALAKKLTEPGFRELRAAREGRVRTVPDPALRPGPRVGQGIVDVARLVHRDLEL